MRKLKRFFGRRQLLLLIYTLFLLGLGYTLLLKAPLDQALAQTNSYWTLQRDSSNNLNFIAPGGSIPVMGLTSVGNLGIGTSAPGAKLEISDGTNKMRFFPGLANVIRADDWGSSFEFRTTQSSGTVNNGQLYLGSTGNVGIGNPSPSQKLQVGNAGGGAASEGVIRSSTNNNAGGARDWDFGAGVSNFGNWGFNIKDVGANANRLSIDLNGYVGIGTVSPSTFGDRLVVENDSGVTPLVVVDNVPGAWVLKKVRSDNNGAVGIYDPSGYGVMGFYESGAERMRITGGRIGIRTGTPISDLHIKQSSDSQYNGGITLESLGGYQGSIFMGGDGRVYLFARNAPSYSYLTIDAGGLISTSPGGSFQPGSSKTIKENFASIDRDEILTKIDQMPIMEWNYINQDPSDKHIGPFSEDFHATFGLNGTRDKTVNLLDESGVALVGVQALSEKVKKQQEEIDLLKKEVEELKNK